VSKKTNTILFLVGATIANVVMIALFWLGLTALYGATLAARFGPQGNQIALIVILVLAVAITYFLYHRIVKWISKKWDLDEHFDPIFSSGKKKKD
jgi:membrane protein YdbS with pleckstrin-like domain